jgi:hypothetical protein
MKKEHFFDPEFRFVSRSLKQAIELVPNNKMDQCVDMPTGNGRNVFYLSQFFKSVIAVDINGAYLKSIDSSSKKYHSFNKEVTTSRIDLAQELPREIEYSEFICTIHHFSYSLIQRVIEKMKNGSYYYIETPNCHGDNFLELPTEQEIDRLFKNVSIVFLERHICNADFMNIKHVSFKCLLKK